jgi:predicted SprT family Zn-dependent metalloprotease
MDRKEIFSLARQLMDHHGLKNWGLKWIDSKSFAGLCHTSYWHINPAFSRGRIELSTAYFDVFSDYDIRDTILHEIAHALTPTPKQKTSTGRTRYIHHGAEWKAKAKEIGCSGERCVREEANRPKARYKGLCPSGHEHFRHRLTKTAKFNQSCGKCSSQFDRRYMLDWWDNGVLVHSQKPVEKKPTTVPVPVPTKRTWYAVNDSTNLSFVERERLMKVLESIS